MRKKTEKLICDKCKKLVANIYQVNGDRWNPVEYCKECINEEAERTSICIYKDTSSYRTILLTRDVHLCQKYKLVKSVILKELSGVLEYSDLIKLLPSADIKNYYSVKIYLDVYHYNFKKFPKLSQIYKDSDDNNIVWQIFETFGRDISKIDGYTLYNYLLTNIIEEKVTLKNFTIMNYLFEFKEVEVTEEFLNDFLDTLK